MGGYYRLKELGYRLPASGHVMPPAQDEAMAAATRIIEDAEVRSAAIVEEAKEAYRREETRGYQDGLAAARLADVKRLLNEGRVLDEALRRIGDELAEVTIAAMRKLSRDFSDFAKAEAVVRSALAQMRREKKAELRVAPQQYLRMREAIAGIALEFPEIDMIDVVEDASLLPPRVILETGIGRVDGDFSDNLDEIERAIRSVAENIMASEAVETFTAGGGRL